MPKNKSVKTAPISTNRLLPILPIALILVLMLILTILNWMFDVLCRKHHFTGVNSWHLNSAHPLPLGREISPNENFAH